MDVVRVSSRARTQVRTFLETPSAREATQRIVARLADCIRFSTSAEGLESWWEHTYGSSFRHYGVGTLSSFLLKLHVAGIVRYTYAPGDVFNHVTLRAGDGA